MMHRRQYSLKDQLDFIGGDLTSLMEDLADLISDLEIQNNRKLIAFLLPVHMSIRSAHKLIGAILAGFKQTTATEKKPDYTIN